MSADVEMKRKFQDNQGVTGSPMGKSDPKRPQGKLASILDRLLRALGLRGRYRPELHYMRGRKKD